MKANSLISKEKYLIKIKKFRDEDNTPKERWRKMKNETGQNKQTTPEILIEGNKTPYSNCVSFELSIH